MGRVSVPSRVWWHPNRAQQGFGGAVGAAVPPHRPLLLVVAQEGAVGRGVGVVEEGEEQLLPEFQGEGELAAQLPHAVEEEEEKRRLLLPSAVGGGGAGTAQLEGVAGLRDPEGDTG